MRFLYDDVKDADVFNSIIKRLNGGERLKKIAEDYHVCKSALNKRLNSVGIKQDKQSKIWYLDINENRNALQFINSVDIEERICNISEKRYYSAFKNWGYGESEKENVMKSNWINVYEEYVELAKEHNCDFDIEYMLMILLEHLERIDKKDLREEFCIKSIKENENATKEEIDFLLSKIKEGYRASSLMGYLDDWECNAEDWEQFLKENRSEADEL